MDDRFDHQVSMRIHLRSRLGHLPTKATAASSESGAFCHCDKQSGSSLWLCEFINIGSLCRSILNSSRTLTDPVKVKWTFNLFTGLDTSANLFTLM